jgi:AbrB family looped-hinge helix DNA binding protein
MITVTVSSKYQIVIPKKVREELDIRVGQKIQLIPYQNRIEFVPLIDIKKMRGFLEDINTDVPRKKDRI